jgi:hypothetical protein
MNTQALTDYRRAYFSRDFDDQAKTEIHNEIVKIRQRIGYKLSRKIMILILDYTTTPIKHYQCKYQKIPSYMFYSMYNYAKNRAYKLKYQYSYNTDHTSEIKDYQHSYYEKIKHEKLQKLAQKITCECGRTISRGQLTTHKKSSIHFKFLKIDSSTNRAIVI